MHRVTGGRPFSELTKDFTPERRRRVDVLKEKLAAEMPQHELRRTRALPQRDLAEFPEGEVTITNFSDVGD